jgi:hypothetical protein
VGSGFGFLAFRPRESCMGRFDSLLGFLGAGDRSVELGPGLAGALVRRGEPALGGPALSVAARVIRFGAVDRLQTIF